MPAAPLARDVDSAGDGLCQLSGDIVVHREALLAAEPVRQPVADAAPTDGDGELVFEQSHTFGE
ncbi:hypothetical protein AU193_15865 [Mycobacterium sp. GA-1285]|nr:hypothetical protein AU193_15865 [Mycobacterium sp. GA-1285]